MKRISLDQMKNMSIDNLIELYRDGYRLEEHTPIALLSNLNGFNFSNIYPDIYSLQGPLLDPVLNFGKVTISTGYDTLATSIILNTNEGSKLPDPSVSGAFNLVWWNFTDYPDPSDDPNREIVRCTARVIDTLTVTRAQEGTSASVKNLAGKTYKMILSVTAKTITDISSAITARVAKAGDTMTGTLNLPVNGLVVGTNQLTASGGNIGIGTTIPVKKLQVQTEGSGGDGMLLNASGTISPRISFGSSDTGTTYMSMDFEGLTNDEFRIYKEGMLPAIAIKYVTGNIILGQNGGSVGIGTTTPGYRGDISGSFRVGGASQPGASSGYGIEFHAGTTRSQIYAYNRSTASPIDISLQEAGGNVILFGNVGIGTISPGTKLGITGSGFTEISLYSGDISYARIWYGTGGNYATAGSSWNVGIRNDQTLNNAFIFESNAGPGWVPKLAITQGGNVGIGIVAPTYQLQLSLDSAAKPGTNTWTISSDERIKKDIRPFTDGIETIININPVWYKYNGKAGFKDDNENRIGVIGQHIQKIAPYTINTYKAKLNEDDKDETELLNFNSHALTFVLINAIKEINKTNKEHEENIQKLKEEIKVLSDIIRNLT